MNKGLQDFAEGTLISPARKYNAMFTITNGSAPKELLQIDGSGLWMPGEFLETTEMIKIPSN